MQGRFPRAKFIHLVRDGRDCAVSGWFHNRRISPDWLNGAHPSLDAYSAATAVEWGLINAAVPAAALDAAIARKTAEIARQRPAGGRKGEKNI